VYKNEQRQDAENIMSIMYIISPIHDLIIIGTQVMTNICHISLKMSVWKLCIHVYPTHVFNLYLVLYVSEQFILLSTSPYKPNDQNKYIPPTDTAPRYRVYFLYILQKYGMHKMINLLCGGRNNLLFFNE